MVRSKMKGFLQKAALIRDEVKSAISTAVQMRIHAAPCPTLIKAVPFAFE
jgi:hypothetical protein